jgi:hypothetical protein
MSRFRTVSALLGAGLALGSIAPAEAADDPPKPIKGGYYVGESADGQKMTLDVASSGKLRIAAVQFAYDCPGEGRTKASAQNIDLKAKPDGYAFKDSQNTHVLFPSFLSEKGRIEVSGHFPTKKRVTGKFEVTSPSCGDTGRIGFKAKVR